MLFEWIHNNNVQICNYITVLLYYCKKENHEKSQNDKSQKIDKRNSTRNRIDKQTSLK